MIIAIHVYSLSFINDDIDYIFTRIIFRICVPLFLMITGYFIILKSLKDINILKKYTIKYVIISNQGRLLWKRQEMN